MISKTINKINKASWNTNFLVVLLKDLIIKMLCIQKINNFTKKNTSKKMI
jgi:hypothetical protein